MCTKTKLDFLKNLLNEKYYKYNTPTFIETDPIAVPHSFSTKENIEISGFLTATIAWGQRTSILKNAFRLMKLMDNDPFDFVMNAATNDYKVFDKFCHRTFNSVDTIFFIKSLSNIYKNNNGLEAVFTSGYMKDKSIQMSLGRFRKLFFDLPHDCHTEKHVPDAFKNSACKRLNLFLRWMVRNDNQGVDFGIWNDIPASALFIPLDVHTANVARSLELLKRKQNDWKAVEELTLALRAFDPTDPVKYDFALFGLGIFENFAKLT